VITPYLGGNNRRGCEKKIRKKRGEKKRGSERKRQKILGKICGTGIEKKGGNKKLNGLLLQRNGVNIRESTELWTNIKLP